MTESEQFSKIFSFAAPEGATQFFGGAPLGVPSKNCAKLVFYEIATNIRSVPEPAAGGGGARRQYQRSENQKHIKKRIISNIGSSERPFASEPIADKTSHLSGVSGIKLKLFIAVVKSATSLTVHCSLILLSSLSKSVNFFVPPVDVVKNLYFIVIS